jgi:hypothetical protein
MHQTFNCPHCGAPGQVNYGQASYACTCRLTHQGHYKSTDERFQQRELDRLRRELAEAREWIAMARDRIGCGCVGGSDAGLCCVCDDRLARIDAAMASP